jgi:hypothetical protein
MDRDNGHNTCCGGSVEARWDKGEADADTVMEVRVQTKEPAASWRRRAFERAKGWEPLPSSDPGVWTARNDIMFLVSSHDIWTAEENLGSELLERGDGNIPR